MTIEKIKKLIELGEGTEIEFKEAKEALNNDVYDTVCAFSNRNGGHILLGVSDKKEIVGVNKDKVVKMIKDFCNTLHNPEKIYPPMYVDPLIYEIEGKTVVYIWIPEGYQVRKHKGKIFDRSNDGDINITNNFDLESDLYIRKRGSYFVNRIYTDFDISSLDESTINKARQLALLKKVNHPWKDLSNEELLRTSNLIVYDYDKKKEGVTLAAILLFGKKSTIDRVIPHYRTDAILRVNHKDRYDDREVVNSNLIESFDELLQFGQKHLKDFFVLDGVLNVSARDLILREVISNTLAHRDFSSSYVAKIIIDDDYITVENSNLDRGTGFLDLQKFDPFPKNPPISKIFREIGIADELGSGVRNTYKYCKLYTGQDPSFEEGHIFTIKVPITNNVIEKDLSHDVYNNVYYNKDALIDFIKEKIRENNKISREEIAQKAGISEKTIGRIIKGITAIRFKGIGRHGFWELDE